MNKDKKYNEKQKALGIRVRGFRINDREWELLKRFLKKIRAKNNA